MSKSCRLLASTSSLLSSASRARPACREVLLCLEVSTLASSVRNAKRHRLLYTSPPLRATIVTSASAHSSTPSTSSGSASELQSPEYVGLKTSRYADATQEAELVRAPSEEDIEEAELDADVLPASECKFLMHERAAEQLQRISTRENDPDVALRISVESGGCHGYQYKLFLTSLTERQPEDYVFSHKTIRPSNVLIDAVSLPLMKGSRLDFVTELIGSSFRVDDNPQAKGSGCGCGVSWELKL